MCCPGIALVQPAGVSSSSRSVGVFYRMARVPEWLGREGNKVMARGTNAFFETFHYTITSFFYYFKTLARNPRFNLA